MADETFYFSHDYNSRNDPKMVNVLMELGQAGKGIYWDLIEMSYEQGGKLLLSQCKSYAFALRTDLVTINSLINDFLLFDKDDTFFWSDSCLRRLDKRNSKSLKAKESANKRWGNANASDLPCEGNAIKESKVNKSKEISIIEKEKNNFSENQNKDYKLFMDWIERNTPELNKLPKPITINEFLILKGELPNSKGEFINLSKLECRTYLESIENNKTYLKKYRSPYLCILAWHKSNQKNKI